MPDMRRTLDLENAFGRDVSVVPLEDQIVGNLRPMLLVLLGAVGFIVLIAGANVGNLLLARAGFRQQEMAVRSALGAKRTRLIRQLLSESVMLAGCGGILGLALGVGGVRALKTVLPATIPRLQDVTVDLRVLAVCAAVTLVIGLIFGLAPAWLASGNDLQGTLRAGRAGERGGFGRRMRGALVVSEVALSVVLVIGAGLMIETMWQISRVNPGFRATNVLTLRVQPSGPGYETRQLRVQYFVDVLEQVRGVPGVEVVGATQHLPLSGFDWHRDTDIEGRPPEPGAAPFRPGWRTVAGDYFKAMAIPLQRGRGFEASDIAGSPGVVLVNETFARSWLAGADPIGKRLVLKGGAGTDSVTIIGVVGDVRHRSLTTPAQPEIFLSVRQFPQGSLAIVARTTGDPMRLARTIYERVASVDRTVPISNVRPLDQLVSSSVATPRVVMFLLVAFAAVGLVLGAVGIYGVVNYAVSSRVREIGIRIALGAARARVAGHVVREGIGYAVVGVVAGVAAAAALSRAMQTLLFGVSPTDAVVYLCVSLALLLTAAIASYLPARRAAGIDPVVALRAD
jgi:putative ABC transport system permease protein